jgi:hypothetical protein
VAVKSKNKSVAHFDRNMHALGSIEHDVTSLASSHTGNFHELTPQ